MKFTEMSKVVEGPKPGEAEWNVQRSIPLEKKNDFIGEFY